MTNPPIDWDRPARRLAADPAATVALGRSAWEALGASFTELDDGQGERPGLATATVETSGGAVPIGVLDYGESSTYLLVPGAEPDRFATTAAVLELLESVNALRLDRDLLDLADGVPVPTLEERLGELELQLHALVQPQVGAAGGGPVEMRAFGESALLLQKPRPQRGAVMWFSEDAGYGFIQPTYAIQSPDLVVRGGGVGKGIVGTVKWFDSTKGFGSITPADGGRDLFVRHKGLVAESYFSMVEGAKVAYEVEPRGERAPPSGGRKGSSR